ncbi:DJ-1/PfpI family protein [Roseomonas terrae]|jgi:cyclohexyl-isocyanide hydratase|uniref:DJ-1/PfpI family protein n=1 Tax=Neoroseomonas terrae TaxID=424799 RepID=A0ABS5EN86_9PROT|nr:DJ-1/PfpI family protein [Neoroseomonas terrae]MBR0652486.1 DJ-1/PfpI family protein [Neoroseomonas terrae]
MSDTPRQPVAGILVFPGVTQLDMTGPFEVLARMPGWRVEVVAKARGPVRSDRGLVLHADTDFAAAPQYDLLAVPGGPGTDDAILDADTVDFVRRQGAGAGHVFGICTGSLLLGAAGLLRGRRAGSHWMARDLLPRFGATVSDARMTQDGTIYTAGGVTSGIDMALRVAADLVGEEAAQRIQLAIEYDPEPPFRAGTPFVAPPALVAGVREAAAANRARRAAAVEEAARRLDAAGG